MALELDDDHETLEAALALIDAWELDICGHNDTQADAALEPSLSPVTTVEDDSDALSLAPSPSLVRGSRRRKLSSHDEELQQTAAKQQMSRREELVFLRRKVRAMETELASFRDPKTDGDTASPTATQLDAAWVWQQIAARQLEYRHASEFENLRLRVQVEEQLTVAKDLLRVLLRAYRRGDQNQTDEIERQDNVKRVKLPSHTQLEMSEADQLRLVDELYSERDAIFGVAPFTGGPPTLRTIHLLEHTNGETTINVDSSWVLPFSVAHITSAFWMYLVRKHEPTKWKFEPADGVDDERDVLTAKFESSGTVANGQTGTLLGQFVARCVRSSDGQEPAFVVWHKRSHPVNFAPLSMDGVGVHSQSIMRIVWADHAAGDCTSTVSSGDRGRLCLVQMSQRTHVAFAAAETPTRRRRVGALTEFLMGMIESELSWKQQVLENLLLRSKMPTAPSSAPMYTYSSIALRSHSETTQ